MGLDTSHDCWHGAYGSFREFREGVGRAAGLPYRVITESGYDKGSYTLDIDWDIYTEANLEGDWDTDPVWQQKGDIYGHPKQDDVLYLLIHSDCDGVLRSTYLPRLKKRLEELVPAYDAWVDANYDRHYYKHDLKLFIDGLTKAIEAGEDVDFH